MYSFGVHSNDILCRKRWGLGPDPSYMICYLWAWFCPIIIHGYGALVVFVKLVMIHCISLVPNKNIYPQYYTQSIVCPYCLPFCLNLHIGNMFQEQTEYSTSYKDHHCTCMKPTTIMCVVGGVYPPLNNDKESTINVSLMCLVTFKYFNTLSSSSQSYLSVRLTLVVIN